MNEEELKEFCRDVTLSVVNILFGYVKNSAPHMSEDDFRFSIDSIICLGQNIDLLFYDEDEEMFYSVLVEKCLIGELSEAGTIDNIYKMPKYCISGDISLRVEEDVEIDTGAILNLIESQRTVVSAFSIYEELSYSFYNRHFGHGNVVTKLSNHDICAMLNIGSLIDLCTRYIIFTKITDVNRVININSIRDELNREIYLDEYDLMSINLMIQEFANLICNLFDYSKDGFVHRTVWAIPTIRCNIKHRDGKGIYTVGDLPDIIYKAFATVEYVNQYL